MSRAVVFSELKNDGILQGFWPGGIPVYGSNATDSPDRKRPFIIVKFRGRVKAFGNTGAEEVAIWAHMPTGLGRDYTTIDAILNRAKEVLTGLSDVLGSDGWAFTEATWLGTSEDLLDDGYNTLTKNAYFRIASRYVSFVALG